MAGENDVLTRNDDGDLAVRTVNSTEALSSVLYDDVFTRDTDGKLCIRTVGNGGGGGGDQHNLGWYATQLALETAHPTATAGDWAIVGATDTVWIWDTDNSVWVDSDQKGQVTSVNNQTGDVTVQETLVSGTNIKTIDGNSVLGSGDLELSTYLAYPAGWTTNSTTKAFCDSISADTTATVGKAYLGEVTINDLPVSIANGEIVVEIMSGTTAQDKVIVLTLTSGNTAPYMWKYTYWNGGTNTSGWKTWATSEQGAKADTAVQPADLATVATTGEYSDLSGTPTIPDPTQVSTLPTASATEEGKIYQFIGTTTASYTNGYFYKCVSDGQQPATYSWTQVNVQPAPVIPDPLPSQTGNAGKFLTTNGTAASWADITSTPSTMPTLAVADWSNNTQTVNVTGVTATNTVFVSPAPASAADYASAGIVCTAQGAGTLTFTCTTVPSNAITVNVVCL